MRWTWAHGCQPIWGLRLFWWFTGKQSSSFGQFLVCFPDRFGTTEVSSDHPKFYFFYEIQREVLILLLPGRYHFMSSLSISQYTRARAIGLDLSFCIDPWWYYRDAHSLWAPEPKGNNRLFIRQSVHPCRSPQQDPGHANLFPCSWGGWGCRGQNWVAKGGGEMNWGVGVDIYALLIPCIIQMTNENLLYHTGTSTWCSVVP